MGWFGHGIDDCDEIHDRICEVAEICGARSFMESKSPYFFMGYRFDPAKIEANMERLVNHGQKRGDNYYFHALALAAMYCGCKIPSEAKKELIKRACDEKGALFRNAKARRKHLEKFKKQLASYSGDGRFELAANGDFRRL